MHTMDGPFTVAQVTKIFGPHWNGCPTFAIDQTADPATGPKWCVIHDHLRSGINSITYSSQKVRMDNIDIAMSILKRLCA